jgi:hypothetical protein
LKKFKRILDTSLSKIQLCDLAFLRRTLLGSVYGSKMNFKIASLRCLFPSD